MSYGTICLLFAQSRREDHSRRFRP